MAPTTFAGLTPYFVYLLLTATLGPLLFGYHLAELNAPQEVITCAKKSINVSSFTKVKYAIGYETAASIPQCIHMEPWQFGLVSSFFTLGGLVGALSSGPVTARQGRLRAMIYSSAFAVIGPVFEAAAPNIGTLTTGRFLSGIGAGAATVVVPIYISEISPKDKRGLFGAFTQIMTNMGILIVQALGLFLSRGQLWRLILAVGGAIGLVQAVGLISGGQESPKWLAENGKASQGKSILRKIRGPNSNVEDEITAWGFSTFSEEDDEEETLLSNSQHLSQPTPKSNTTSKIGPISVLRHPDYFPAVLAVAAIMVAQQFTGINSIVMYGVSLLSNLLGTNAPLLNVLVAAVNVIITTACAPLTDRWGRKTCLLISISGMGTSSILLAIGIMHSIKLLSAIAVIFFVASFGFGLGPIPFILAAELVNTEAVGATQSWALAANWIATFIVAQFFPLINDSLPKGRVYFIFAGMALGFGTFVAWFVPETKGKKDADEVWGRRKASTLED